MTVHDLLQRLRDRGVQLTVVGDRLRYRCQRGALTPELLDAVTRQRDALLMALRQRAAGEVLGDGAPSPESESNIEPELCSRFGVSKVPPGTRAVPSETVATPPPEVQSPPSARQTNSLPHFSSFTCAGVAGGSPNHMPSKVDEDGTASKASKPEAVLALAARVAYPRLPLLPTLAVIEAGEAAWRSWAGTTRGANVDVALRRLQRAVIALTVRRHAVLSAPLLERWRDVLRVTAADPSERVLERATWAMMVAFAQPRGDVTKYLPPRCAALPPTQLADLIRQTQLPATARALGEVVRLWDRDLAGALARSADAMDHWVAEALDAPGGGLCSRP